ncbi:histidine acid phosphatase like protein [Zymoseptoria brevis]|uniref:Histidine acid phosphatase like protein n=1 Tax=Zymoseptoria brevis TaxID=1047168 RepID=A0A0F4GK88_9PEZI|nr:histidine acid phosphatase like protein [Zymoseptoria brevis]
MLSLFTIIAGLGAFTPLAHAQDDPEYTVWSSVVLTRTGERTPDIITDSPTVLTSIGANQAYAAGEFFRNRYIVSNSTDNSTNGLGTARAPIRGLNADTYDSLQTWVLTRDQQYLTATAQAFLQGLYPPRSPSADPNDITADNTYITGPLNGYQYPFIQAASDLDPNYIYLDATHQCPSFTRSIRQLRSTTQFNTTQTSSSSLYTTLGNAFSSVLDLQYWNYRNAYALYDYLRHQNAHNSTAKTLLSNLLSDTTDPLSTLRSLADAQQSAQLANLTAYNPATSISGYRAHSGSISTIAGNFLASSILTSLSTALRTSTTSNKLTLLFTDYTPFTSFFALASLPSQSSNFTGLPSFAASMVFEVFSSPPATSSSSSNSSSIPPIEDLRVRFLYRNGTDDGERFLSYPLFGRPKAQADMSWLDFAAAMRDIAIDDVSSWCDICGATRYDAWICAANDLGDGGDGYAGRGGGRGRGRGEREGLSPVVSGIIGAVVALAVAGLIFGAVMLLAGLRLRRRDSSSSNSGRKSSLGGFKGGRKMASDQDLTIPKGGGAGATVVEVVGHERVGSWELGKSELGSKVGNDDGSARPSMQSERPSMEERGADPCADGLKPVVPHERV